MEYITCLESETDLGLCLSHTDTHLLFCHSVYQSIVLFICLFVCLSIITSLDLLFFQTPEGLNGHICVPFFSYPQISHHSLLLFLARQ